MSGLKSRKYRALIDLQQSHSTANTEMAAPCRQMGLFNPSLHFCSVNTLLSSKTKATNSNLSSAPQTHGKVNGVYCTFAPLPSLWGRTHFDRPVFMANWSHVGMNHETDQSSGWMSISTDRWSAVRLVVCGPYRENRTCLYEFSYV